MIVCNGNATTPKLESTKTSNSDSWVSCTANSNWDSSLTWIWVCTEEFRYCDLVDFEGVAWNLLNLPANLGVNEFNFDVAFFWDPFCFMVTRFNSLCCFVLLNSHSGIVTFYCCNNYLIWVSRQNHVQSENRDVSTLFELLQLSLTPSLSVL